MAFPLSREPGVVAVVDDQLPYLEDLVFLLPKELALQAFTSSLQFVEQIQQEMEKRKQIKAALREAAQRSERGVSPLVEAIKYWSGSCDRFGLTQVVLMDYYMDQMSGMSALELCREWPGKRVLITGAAEDARILKAFNDGEIDRYVPKNDRSLGIRVLNAVKETLEEYALCHEDDWSPWSNTHNNKSKSIFRNAEVAKVLGDLLGAECEYITIGNPLGVLALGYEGGVRYIALQTTDGLQDAAEKAQKSGASDDSITAIKSGGALSNVDCHIALGTPLVCAPTTFSVALPEMGTHLHGAVFDVRTPFEPMKEQCFRAWREKVRSALPTI